VKIIQIDAWCVIGLMVHFSIIWTAALLDTIVNDKTASVGIIWLQFIIWFSLDIVALFISVGAVYVRAKFKQRSDLVPGNVRSYAYPLT
jgi:hypothetical protein